MYKRLLNDTHLALELEYASYYGASEKNIDSLGAILKLKSLAYRLLDGYGKSYFKQKKTCDGKW